MTGRALILAGGGVRVAWQAGAVQALDEAGLAFDHADGTSGGIFTLGMLLSGVAPAELGARWRSLPVRRFVSLLPPRAYLRSPTAWDAVGSARGIVQHVLPALGIDVARIRAATAMTGTFNVADFDDKRCVAVPHDQIDLERLVAGVSLPVLMPAVQAHGRTWTDAVWIKDANLLEAVRRGCDELWVLWCIANTSYWGAGPLEQYVHMIELSANGALGAELEQIADINRRRAAGEAVHGGTGAVVVHVVRPVRPLPLDPDFLAGRISAETLVAMGYRDAWAALEARSAAGAPLDASATRTPPARLGARLALRLGGVLPGAVPVALRVVVEVADLAAFSDRPAEGTPAVGWFEHPAWGTRPFIRATLSVDHGPDGRRLRLQGRILVDRRPHDVEATTVLGDGPRRWRRAASWDVRVCDEADRELAGGRLVVSRREALRAVLAFEPAGAHGVRDRVAAARATVRFLRRRR